MTWHVQETRSRIERLFGREQLALARQSIKSALDRLDYARFHFQEAQAQLDGFTRLAQESLKATPLFVIALDTDHEANEDYELAMMRIGAHTTALVLSLHALRDTFAHVVFYALGLNHSSALDEDRVKADTVVPLLQADPRYKSLGRRLQALAHEGAAHHIGALSNHSKHRSIVQAVVSEDWTGQRPKRHELQFAPFRYRSVDYPGVAVLALVEPEYERCSRIVVETGIELNLVLQGIDAVNTASPPPPVSS